MSTICTPWCAVSDLSETARGVLSQLQDGTAGQAIAAASHVLWGLSGRRWNGGGCLRTVELTLPRQHATSLAERWSVRRSRGRQYGAVTPMGVHLPNRPVTAVAEVRDGAGQVIPASQWRLVDDRTLERLDPATGTVVSWPDVTITVSYTWGAAPPADAVRAAAAYASQLVLAAARDATCRLPQRVQTITRQGLTAAVLDPFDFLDQGRTGVLEVDQWLAVVNPAGLTRPPSVWSPDTSGPAVRTTT